MYYEYTMINHVESQIFFNATHSLEVVKSAPRLVHMIRSSEIAQRVSESKRSEWFGSGTQNWPTFHYLTLLFNFFFFYFSKIIYIVSIFYYYFHRGILISEKLRSLQFLYRFQQSHRFLSSEACFLPVRLVLRSPQF